MKLVQIDGYSRDEVADILIYDNLTSNQGVVLLEAYLKAFGTDEVSFALYPDDYRLSRGMEDLV